MGVRFQSNKPFISSYAVRLLSFLDVRSMFNVSCICGIISLHSWMGQLASMVAMWLMMWCFTVFTAGSAALAL